MKNNELFEVGLKVWSLAFGWGKVTYFDENVDFPVKVEYLNGETAHYSVDGREYKGENRTLFFDEIPIPESALKKPLRTAEEMLENCEEIKYKFNEDNFYIYVDDKKNVCYTFSIKWRIIGIKYISEKDAEHIVNNCKENEKMRNSQK